jgi:hypothetical protein
MRRAILRFRPRAQCILISVLLLFFSYILFFAAGAIPCARAWHTAVYVPALRGLVVFGGRDGSDRFLNDTSLFVVGAQITYFHLCCVLGLCRVCNWFG